MPSADPFLRFDEREIRRHGPRNLMEVCWRQWQTERQLARRGVRFRTTAPEVVAAAYGSMSDQEFEWVNGRQGWANWRTIPRALNGRVADRPLRVLDLGCGTGTSTQVLAFYCPPGSCITAYELAAPLAEVARRRRYAHRSGQSVAVEVCCQGVTEPLRQPDGRLVPERSVDLVNASGVVGHHLNPKSVRPLVAELRRVLATDGVAMLDVGPTLWSVSLTKIMTKAGFRRLGHWRSWVLDPTGQVVFRAT